MGRAEIFVLGVVATGIAIYGAIAYVAIHFVIKFW
jgi:hypothetical protein